MTNTRTDIIRDYRKHLKKEVIPAFEKRYTALAQMEFGAWLVADPKRTEMLLEDYKKLITREVETIYVGSYNVITPKIARIVGDYHKRLTRLSNDYIKKNLDIFTRSAKMGRRKKPVQAILERKFIEAKWLRNAALAEGMDNYDTSRTTVNVLNKKTGEMEEREFTALSAQERQAVIQQLKDDRKSLNKKKKKGHKVGKLRFSSSVKTIPLPQYGKTFKFNDNLTYIQIAGLGWIPVRGLDQISEMEIISRACIVKVGCDYYVHITGYRKKVPDERKKTKKSVIAFDMGVHDAITCGDASKFNLRFDYTETSRKLQRELSRKEKGSRGWRETKDKLEHELAKTTNSRDDAANKTFFMLTRNETIISQDDPLTAWKVKKSRAHGSKKVAIGILGRIKAKMQEGDNCVLLPRNTRTTAICPFCHAEHAVSLSEQGMVECPRCHEKRPRNIGAAWAMEYAAYKQQCEELPPSFKPLEAANAEEALQKAIGRSGWPQAGYDVDSARVLDALLGHVDYHEPDWSADMPPRKRAKAKARKSGKGWTSKKLSHGKVDKWSSHSRHYASYAAGDGMERVGDGSGLAAARARGHSDEARRERNARSHKSHAERSLLRRRLIDHGSCRRLWDLLAAGMLPEDALDDSGVFVGGCGDIRVVPCTPGTGGINAGEDGVRLGEAEEPATVNPRNRR